MIRKDCQLTPSRLAVAALGLSLSVASIAGCTGGGMEGAHSTDLAMAGSTTSYPITSDPVLQMIDYTADEPYGSAQQ